jgi:dTDP-4-amino-4,6-dideoxygalactose transaminase
VLARLWAAGIEAARYGAGSTANGVPVAADLFARSLALPLHPGLDAAQVDVIATTALAACARVEAAAS